MSYGLELVGNARRAFLELQPDVQEEVLDILERIAEEVAGEDEDVTPSPRPGKQVLLYRSDQGTAVVYLYYSVKHDSRTVTLNRLVAVMTGE